MGFVKRKVKFASVMLYLKSYILTFDVTLLWYKYNMWYSARIPLYIKCRAGVSAGQTGSCAGALTYRVR